MYLHHVCPAQWLPGCPGCHSSVVSLTSRPWALVIHFIWRLPRAGGLKFAGWGRPFDSVWSVKWIKGLALQWYLSASRWQECAPYLRALRFMSAELENGVYLFDLMPLRCRCSLPLSRFALWFFFHVVSSMSFPVESFCAQVCAHTWAHTHTKLECWI